MSGELVKNRTFDIRRSPLCDAAAMLLALWCIFSVATPTAAAQDPGSNANRDAWQHRASEFGVLTQGPTAASPAVARACIPLLRAENALIRTVLQATDGQRGVTAVYGEGYSDYYTKLFETVLTLARSGDPEALQTLAGGAYDPNSESAAALAEFPQIVLPVLLKDAKDSSQIVRSQAIAMVGHAAGPAAPLDAATRSQVNAALLSALSDDHAVVRVAAVRAVGDANAVQLLPALSQVALQDPQSIRMRGVTQYPVREEARKVKSALELQLNAQ